MIEQHCGECQKTADRKVGMRLWPSLSRGRSKRPAMSGELRLGVDIVSTESLESKVPFEETGERRISDERTVALWLIKSSSSVKGNTVSEVDTHPSFCRSPLLRR